MSQTAERCSDLVGACEQFIARPRSGAGAQPQFLVDADFASLNGTGFKANFEDIESGAQYWISGCKKDGLDRFMRT